MHCTRSDVDSGFCSAVQKCNLLNFFILINCLQSLNIFSFLMSITKEITLLLWLQHRKQICISTYGIRNQLYNDCDTINRFTNLFSKSQHLDTRTYKSNYIIYDDLNFQKCSFSDFFSFLFKSCLSMLCSIFANSLLKYFCPPREILKYLPSPHSYLNRQYFLNWCIRSTK